MLAVNLFVLVAVAFSHIVASEKAVVCYYGTWATYRNGQGKFDVANINPHLCTHLIYAFVGLDTQGNIISLDSYLDLPDNNGRDNFRTFNGLKNQNQGLKTLVAVGGWNEGSAKFSAMAASPSLRQNFINSALKMITTYGFDGLDLDWEYPNRRDTVHGAADIDNFTTLLKEIRAVFDKKSLLLTAAVSATKASASRSYDVVGISKYLDIVNIMTYDMHGSWDPVTGHNAPLHQGEGDDGEVAEDLNNVEQSLKYWINAGCPPEKIAVGVPFYGRTFTLSDASENGVRASSSGAGIAGPYTASNGFIGYNEFCYKLQTESWTERIDSLAKVPYAVKDRDWVSYDDPKSITAKIKYAKQFNISKIMMWSIETDDFHGICGNGANPLLTAINQALDIEINNTNPSTTKSPNSVSSSTTESPNNVSSSTTKAPNSETISVCKEVGYIAKPGDCSRFLYCIRDTSGGFIPKEFQCPASLYWDQTLLTCNFPSMVACEQ